MPAVHALRVQGPDSTDTSGDPLPVNLQTSGAPLTSLTSPGSADTILSGAYQGIAVVESPLLYNGVSHDRQRNNNDLTLLASATRTVTTNSADQTNFNARGLIYFLNITANASAAGIRIYVQGKDPVSGNYFYMHADPTAVTTTGVFGYSCYPGASSAGGNVSILGIVCVPRIWRCQVIHLDASNVTYSVGCSLIV